MKRILLASGAVLAGTLGAAAQTTKNPNIILFLVDDMGWQETSVPFYKDTTALNHRYRTPNMERMAKMGVKFTQAFASAISSPSRCSLMTGMNPARHRVTNWTHQYGSTNDAANSVLTMPDWNYNGLQPDTVTSVHDRTNTALATALPQLLKDHGYYTIHCGKAHWGAIGTAGENPLAFGFDVNIAGGANGSPASYLAQDNYGSGLSHVPGLEEYYAKGTFLTDALTQEALKAMAVPIAANRPFYLYMSHYAIHTPYNPDSRFVSNYRQADGQGVYDEQLQANLNEQEINHAALVEGMDESLGKIMDFLEAQPEVAKNTILIFMSDNGGQGVGVRQGRANYDQSYPHRGGKGSAYEGGVHEPMMVYWPGVTEGGTENANRVGIEDFFPTILEMAGASDYQCSQTVDGKSFVDLIRNPQLSREKTLIWHYPNIWGESQDKAEGYNAYSAIMKGDYHLIYFWENQERRLYNVKEDVGERNNLAKSMPELTKSLAQELTDSLISFGAQRPKLKSTGKLVPWPVDGVQIVTTGDPVDPTTAFRYSTDAAHYYYTISDKRGPFYWTQGTHNGFNALQSTTEAYTDTTQLKQLFYMMPGEDDMHFRLYTYQGAPVDYVNGTTGSSWNNGNPSPLVQMPYLQYGTESAGEFQLIKSATSDYYGFSSDGTLMNDRGTRNGSAVNMTWVIATYSGNNVSDPASIYKFTQVKNPVTGIAQAADDSVRGVSRQELSRIHGLKLYDTQGKRVKNLGEAPSGIYIVKQSKDAYKVCLR